MTELWATLPTIQDTESGIAAIEREQMTKPRPLNVEGPLLYQPSADLYPPAFTPGPSVAELHIDETTRHTIQLIQYSRRIQSMIQSIKQRVDDADETSDVDQANNSEGGYESGGAMNQDDDSAAGSARWRHESQSAEERALEGDYRVDGGSVHDSYRQGSDFSSPVFADITSPLSNRNSQQPAFKKLKK